MGQRYSQLGLDERIEIARLRAAGASLRQIAAALDRAPSSITRELKRNSGAGAAYKPAAAQERHRARRWVGSRLDRDQALREQVLAGLRRGWSPEQVAGRLAQAPQAVPISPESIYRFVHAQIARHKDYSWRHLLPRGKAKRGWRGRRGGSSAVHMAQHLPLSQRPAEALDRTTPGHWEADLMAFSRYGQNILILHERSTRLLIATRLPSKQAAVVAAAIRAMLAVLPAGLLQTMAFDNGTEFARHHDLHALKLATYFCDTHSPWQKGGIENAIGRMRRFLPRKTDLAGLEPDHFIALLAAYNNTPRKCLDFKTPAELFSAYLLHFDCESTFPPARE
jgi:transposase, IS30 family